MKSRLFIVLGLLSVIVVACGSAETLIYTEVPQDLLAQQQQIVQEAAMGTLTAEGSQEQESTATVAPSATLAQVVDEGEVPPSGPAEVIPTDVPPTEPVVDTSTGRPALGFEPGSSNFRATNPVAVSLAAGELQLLEFFAEW